jgi:hypothetical protein
LLICNEALLECRLGRTPVLSLLKRVLHSLPLRPRTILCLGGGRAISRQSVQGYVTWLGEMKFSPSTINQRLAAIRKLATEAQRCGYVDSETAQAIVTVAGVSQKGRRWAGGWRGKKPGHYCRRRTRTAFAECGTGRCSGCW